MKTNFVAGIATIVTLIFLTACQNKNEILILKYNTILSDIDEVNFENVYSHLDDKSKIYVDFFKDTTNINYDRLYSFGKENDLLMITLAIGKWLDDADFKKPTCFVPLGFLDIPMFSVLSKTKLIEDQIKTGKVNYITLARKVDKKKYLSTKVIFHENSEGNFKLDIFSLLKGKNAIRKQQFNQYKKINIDKNLTSTELLKEFYENQFSQEFQLDEIKYQKYF